MIASRQEDKAATERAKDTRRARRSPGVNAVTSALLVAAVGFAVLLESFSYDFGSMRRLGPGFFPLLLGLAIILMSVLLLLDRSRQPILVEAGILRPLFCIPAAMGSFALLIQSHGLLPATISLIVISCLADSEVKVLRTIIMSIVVPPVVVAIFIYGIGLNMAIFRW